MRFDKKKGLKKRILYLAICLFAFSESFGQSFGQDPTFSQFYANPLYLAPSFAGATEDYRLSMSYRNQWPAVPGVFKTYSASFDKSLPNFNSGLGILATYDVAGEGNLSASNIGLVYSYDFNINSEWHIRPGINFKFQYLGLDIMKLIFPSQLRGSGVTSSVYPPPFDNVADIDFATSALIYNDRIWAGFTLDHLLAPKASFYGNDATVPVKFNLFGGMQIMTNARLRQKMYEVLSVAINIQKQSNYYQSDLGVYYLKHPLIFGVWYRGIPFITSKEMTMQMGDAIIGLIGIKTEQFRIGYSYDFTVSSLVNATGGAHEVSITFEFNNPNSGKQRRIRAIPCPEF